MVNVIPPKTPDPVGNDPFGADHSAKPWQFSLKRLLLVMVGGSLAAAAVNWLGTETFGLFAVVFGVWVCLVMFFRSATEVAVLGVLLLLLTMCLLPAMPPRPGGTRSQCQNNLRQIMISLQNYHDVYGSFPPAYVADENGRPMHSWRVLILPFIEQKALYDQYRFDEPWDGPNNSQLAKEIVRVYQCPNDEPPGKQSSQASYVAVIGGTTAWPGEKAVKLGDITDGTSNTILIVEVHNSGIHWMEPRDLHIQQMPLAINPPRGQGIASRHPGGAQVALADGSVRFVPETTPPETVRAMLTIAGGESIPQP